MTVSGIKLCPNCGKPRIDLDIRCANCNYLYLTEEEEKKKEKAEKKKKEKENTITLEQSIDDICEELQGRITVQIERRKEAVHIFSTISDDEYIAMEIDNLLNIVKRTGGKDLGAEVDLMSALVFRFILRAQQEERERKGGV